MFDPADTENLTNSQATHLPEVRVNGKGPNVCTFFRWETVGVRGVKLKSRRIGKTIVTTRQWVREFLDRCNEDRGEPIRTEAARSKAVKRAEKQLAAKGW